MKKFKVKFIKEEAIVQPAVVASDVNTQEESLDDVAQETNLVANTTPTLQEQDVDKLEDKDVMNYVYFNTPDDIDEGTRQALFNRADQIRQKQMNGSTTPKDQEEFAKGVIAAAAQSRNKAKLGESLDYGVQSWVNAITGKYGKKGRNGAANWIGDDLYDEIEKDEDGRLHYFNEWIGKVDRNNKTIYINDEVAPRRTVDALIQTARIINYNVKKTRETKDLLDMGFEDEADPMYVESYTSGRVDTFDEPSWADMDGHFDDEDDDATYRPSYIPTQTSDEFMKSKDGQRSKLLWDLKDAVADKVEELTDGEFDYENVYDFVSDYLDKAHAKYSGEELKKYARVYDSKVDFFAKIIRMKLRNNLTRLKN